MESGLFQLPTSIRAGSKSILNTPEIRGHVTKYMSPDFNTPGVVLSEDCRFESAEIRGHVTKYMSPDFSSLRLYIVDMTLVIRSQDITKH